MAIARQQIRPEILRSLVDQCFLYQQIGPEKLLSLVDQCFLYVILNLEEFPPNYLALLPRQIRKELLLSLPMVDICNLEETAVVEGIEMNDVWQSVRENRVADHVHLHPLSCYRWVAVNFASEPSFFSLCTVGLNLVLKL